MELLFKPYDDKASRMGVTYKYEYLALKAYEDLVRRHRGENFTLQLEPVKSRINLTLRSEQSGKKIVYPDLEYKPDLLKKLDHFVHPGMELLFVHLYREGNQLLVAKPFRKQEFFRITGYDLIGVGLHF